MDQVFQKQKDKKGKTWQLNVLPINIDSKRQYVSILLIVTGPHIYCNRKGHVLCRPNGNRQLYEYVCVQNIKQFGISCCFGGWGIPAHSDGGCCHWRLLAVNCTLPLNAKVFMSRCESTCMCMGAQEGHTNTQQHLNQGLLLLSALGGGAQRAEHASSILLLYTNRTNKDTATVVRVHSHSTNPFVQRVIYRIV